jgi:prepilin-type N-terminal cleavage/methylation domain-containing protein
MSLRRSRTRNRAFSLVEVMVAATVLLLTAAAVSGVVSASLRARGVEVGRAQLEQALQAELSTLAALPYAEPVAPPPGKGYDPASVRCLVQAVFPHAGAAPDLPQAFFTPGAATAPGEFTIVTTTTWGTLRTTAVFVCWHDGWVPVADDQLSGWAAWRQQVPPAPALRLTIEACGGSRSTKLTTVLCGDGPRVADPEAPS